MKIYPDKLESNLKQKILPAYIVSGDEPLLVQEASDLIRSQLKLAGYLERELMHVEGNFDWQQLSYSVNSMSLFAERKIVEMRMSGIRPGDAGAKALTEFAASAGEDTVLLLVMPRLDQAVQRSKWFKTLESISGWIAVWPIEAAQLPRWIEQRFRKAGLQASREAVQVMASRIEGNLLAAVQEIERLKLLSSDGRVDVDLVAEGVADSARYDVFGLLDAAMSGGTARSVRMVRGLQAEGVDLLFITAMLSRELRSLATMALELKQGSLDGALKKGRVWQKRKNVVSRCLREKSLEQIEVLETRIADIDAMVKGIRHGDPWDELINVVCALSGVEIIPKKTADFASR